MAYCLGHVLVLSRYVGKCYNRAGLQTANNVIHTVMAKSIGSDIHLVFCKVCCYSCWGVHKVHRVYPLIFVFLKFVL